MKKAAIFVGVVVVVLVAFIVAQRAWYQKNQAEPLAAEALKVYREAGLPEAYSADGWNSGSARIPLRPIAPTSKPCRRF